MLNEGRPPLTNLAVNIFGIIFLLIGIVLTYFSFIAEIEIISPRIFTPLGVGIIIIGISMILARK
jgi:hypothetical protein